MVVFVDDGNTTWMLGYIAHRNHPEISFKGVLGVIQFLGVHDRVLGRVPIDGVDVPSR